MNSNCIGLHADSREVPGADQKIVQSPLLTIDDHYTVYGIWCRMQNNTATCPILRRMLGYTNDQNSQD
jgi:hypothetical protein